MNTFGTLFRVTTWGESHGKAMGAVIDGCPAGLPLCEEELTSYLQNNDRPLLSLATKRKEPNEVQLLSGISEDITLGTPLTLVIPNRDFRKKDYSSISETFRPGHGDYSYHAKYKTPPLSGGGRASGRECISRLASGYIAGKIIGNHFPQYQGSTTLLSLAGVSVENSKTLQNAIDKALEAAETQDTTGGEILLKIKGVPPGLGGPVFQKLDAILAGALMSIGGVKSVEIGKGKEAAFLLGSQMNDNFTLNNEKAPFSTNNTGGILAGISTGSDLDIKLSVKPTPTIGKKQQGLSINGEIREISVQGRHDLNFTPRVAKVAEAMVHLVILDQLMLNGLINRDRLP